MKNFMHAVSFVICFSSVIASTSPVLDEEIERLHRNEIERELKQKEKPGVLAKISDGIKDFGSKVKDTVTGVAHTAQEKSKEAAVAYEAGKRFQAQEDGAAAVGELCTPKAKKASKDLKKSLAYKAGKAAQAVKDKSAAAYHKVEETGSALNTKAKEAAVAAKDAASKALTKAQASELTAIREHTSYSPAAARAVQALKTAEKEGLISSAGLKWSVRHAGIDKAHKKALINFIRNHSNNRAAAVASSLAMGVYISSIHKGYAAKKLDVVFKKSLNDTYFTLSNNPKRTHEIGLISTAVMAIAVDLAHANGHPINATFGPAAVAKH
ncbi:hypothetical protein FJ365_03280 [Candidatus Dependentiae bacterium]|nr:hypothetical protein [Candidatus Dependentiae bacterium]